MTMTALIILSSLAFDPVTVALAPQGEAFLTPSEVQAARERVASGAPWDAIAHDLLAEADALAAEPLDIPPAGGQWTHWYSCPEDGGHLSANSPVEHVCGVCGKGYTGWPYDDVYITQQHTHWLRGLETLGWAYTLEPKPAYAQRVRDILLEYASFYSDLPLHDKDNGDRKSGARLYAQTLDESVTLCSMMVGYDRVYNNACFSESSHATIAEGLIRPMVATIQRNDSGRSNWQTWHNAGIASAGFVLRDEALVDAATNGKHGLLYQLTEGSVLESGMWYEGAPSYHWYALTAVVYQLEACARAGMDLYGVSHTQNLFDGPMRLVFPDLTYPAINDSNRGSITGARRFYEIAWKRYHDPKYTVFLEPRDSAWALFWGGIPIPEDAPDTLPLGTSNDKSDGLAILRSADGQTALYLDYGPAGSGHVQPAKLGIILYANGDERFVDPGRMPYGNPLHRGWYTTTVAHNTVVVNSHSQKRCAGELVQFEQSSGYDLVRAKTPRAYEGVTLDRTLMMAGNLVIDVVLCASTEEATFDLPLHMRGSNALLPEGAPVAALGKDAGYPHLQDVREIAAEEPAYSLPTGEDTSIAIYALEPSRRLMGKAYGASPQELLPFLLRRIEAKDAWFASVYVIGEPGAGTPELHAEAGKTDDGAIDVLVHAPTGQYRLVVGPEKITRVESP